jgi:RHS repeat-associated protein
MVREHEVGRWRLAGGIAGLLLGLLVLTLAQPPRAFAAECTDTWTGPAEGSWAIASNWSAGVPGEGDVACIGSGKTVNVTGGTPSVQGVQGEGTLTLQETTFAVLGTGETWQLGRLTMKYHGELAGTGTLKIAKAFAWDGESVMSGAAKTILGPESTNTISPGNKWVAVSGNRTLVNEGTTTLASTGTLAMAKGGVFENLGTYNANGENSVWQMVSEGAESRFVNKGLFRKAEGTGTAKLESSFENLGTLRAVTGTIKFYGDEAERSLVLADESQVEGTIVCEDLDVTLGTFTAPEADISFREQFVWIPSGETASLGTVRMKYQGNVSGPGTLEVTDSLHWEGESSMGFGGETLLGPESTNTISPGNKWVAVSTGRTLVNEGTTTLAGYGTLAMAGGGVFENLGTYNANGENSVWQMVSEGLGSQFVNKGLFHKTEGTGTAKLETSFENHGTIAADTGTVKFFGEGRTLLFEDGSNLEGTIVCEEGIASLGTIAAPEADLTLREELAVIPGEKAPSIGTLRMEYEGNLLGEGDLEVTKALDWKGASTMAGTGKTVLTPTANSALSVGGTAATLSQRTLVNEGTFSHTQGKLLVGGGAIFKNRGIYNLNAEPSTSSVLIEGEGKGTGGIVNTGAFQRTKGTAQVKVLPEFQNLGVLNEETSKILIENPVTGDPSEKVGKNCNSADPVECATGNFWESQTDVAVGGRGIGLHLTRSYSAQDAAAASSPGPFGYGWTGTYGDALAIEGGGEAVTLVHGDGSTVPFTKASGTAYEPPAWSQATLSGSPEAGYVLTESDQTELRFSGAGRLEAIADRNDNETTFAYESGRLKTVTDPGGRQLTFAYDGGGQVESVEDPLGNLVKYGYESGNLTSVTMPGESTPRWRFEYDASHRITQVTNGRGGKTTNEYDASSRVTSQTDPAGRTTTFKYEAFHTTVTNKATGAVTDLWFTSNKSPFKITRGYGTAAATTESFAYDEGGRMVKRTDGNGHTTTYGYDADGNRTSEKDAAGETEWAFDATHDLISTTTPRGETTTIERDEDGNVESISRPGPEATVQTTSFDYDEHGQLESVTDPLERTWSFGYDADGNRTSETDPLGNTATLGYDEASRLVSVVSPRGNAEGAEASDYETAIERDPQGRPLKVTDPLGHATEYAYDGNGNLASKTDAKGHTTEFTYNAADERTKVEKPNGAVLETGYDGAGYVTSQTDANGETTTYVRNVLEQPVEVIDPLGRKTSEEFDDAGNLVKVVDPAKRTTSYSYDDADRLVAIDYSDPATADAGFEYDADGNLVAMADGSGESSYAYDELGRLTRSEDGHGDVVEYEYDLAEQQTGVRYPNGKAVARSFDGAGRLEAVTDWLGGTTSFAYDADSNLAGVGFPSASGNVDEYAYDQASRMTEARFERGGETLASLSYVRDQLGQVEEEARHGLPGPEETSYGYDENDRLVAAGGEGYGYDLADNMTSAPGRESSYDEASQLVAATGAAYAYDQLGQRTSATEHATEVPVFGEAFGDTASGPGQLAAPAGLATDSEGNVWVADTSHNRIQVFDSKGEFVRQFGAKGTGDGQFREPRAVAIDAAGNAWVADTGNRRLQKFNSKGEFLAKFSTLDEAAPSRRPMAVAVAPDGDLWTVEYDTLLTNNPKVREWSSAGTLLSSFGSQGSGNGQLAEPAGIAIDSTGNVWVADSGNNRIQAFKASGEFIRKFGSAGTGNGQLQKPKGLAFDAEGKLWVADTLNNRLQRFSAEGTYLAQFGTAGPNSGQFSEPAGVAIDSAGNLWIADTGNNRVQEASATEFIRQFGGDSSGPGQLAAPAGLATDSEGNVWVADTSHNRIQVFDSKGEFVRQFGAKGTGDGQFREPRAVAIDAAGNAWVADTGNRRLQKFNAKGEFLAKFSTVDEEAPTRRPQSVAIAPSGHIWTVEFDALSGAGPKVKEWSTGGTLLSSFGSQGSGNGQMSSPLGIAVDASGNVWVADTGNNRVQAFKASGEFIRTFGTAGSGNGQLQAPKSLAFDSEGNVWVADAGNNRLQRFSAEGSYLAQFGSAGPNNGQFSEPSGIAVDVKGNLWIADTGNNRVQEASATEFVRQFGGSGPGQLAAPAGLATDSEGNVWVADTSHNRVQVFDAEGEFVRQFGAKGSGDGQFSEPRAVAIDASGNAWVADAGNRRLQKFNSKGEFLAKFSTVGEGETVRPQGVAIAPDGHLWTVEYQTSTTTTPKVKEWSSAGALLSSFGSEGAGNGQLKEPAGVAIDASGNVWIADTGNNRVQAFKASGEFIRKFGTAGTGNGQLQRPKGLTFDAEGNLWVADTLNNRLQHFSPEGSYLAQLGTAGPNAGQFSEPAGVAIDGSDSLWIADTTNNRVQEWHWLLSTTDYGYDQAGNLTAVERDEVGGIPAVDQALGYDATGLLVAKTTGLTTRHLAWDASASLPLLLDDGQNSYVYGPGGLPIEQINSKEEPTYLHHDQLGSTRLLTDATGKTSAAFSYQPYGDLEAKTGTAITPLGFAGQLTDSETGLQYLRARFYDPGTGQFLTRDPLAFVTRSPYLYARSNPSRYVDPSGLACASGIPGLGVAFPIAINTGDCVAETVERTADVYRNGYRAALESKLTGPVATLGCIYLKCSFLTSLVSALGISSVSNYLRSQNGCEAFLPNQVKDFLFQLAGSAPPGIFKLVGPYAEAAINLSPIRRQLLEAKLGLPGLIGEIINAI